MDRARGEVWDSVNVNWLPVAMRSLVRGERALDAQPAAGDPRLASMGWRPRASAVFRDDLFSSRDWVPDVQTQVSDRLFERNCFLLE